MNGEDELVYLNFAGFQSLENMYHSSIDLYLSTCGLQNCFGGYSFGPGSRDVFLLHFITDGRGEFECEGTKYQLEKGDVFLIRPGKTVFYRADDKNPWSYIWVGFQGVKAETYLSAAGFEGDNYICRFDNMPFIFTCVQRMIMYRYLSLSNELLRESALLQILSVLIDSHKTKLPKEERYDYPYKVYVDQAVDYIQHHVQEKVKINDIAAYIGIDRSYLANIFKNEIGISPQEYLVSYRMDMAEKMLKETDKKIQEIAREVGYADQMSFSKAFRKYKKMSPTEYRETKSEEERSFR